MEMLISFSSRTLAPAHSAKTTSKWFAHHDITVLDWQPTCLTWTPYGIYGIFSRERWETVDPTIQMSWRLNSVSAVPHADRFHATPHWCWNCAKGAPTKYWVQKWTYFKELELFCFANPFFFFLLILGNILIFWDTVFLTFLSCKL